MWIGGSGVARDFLLLPSSTAPWRAAFCNARFLARCLHSDLPVLRSGLSSDLSACSQTSRYCVEACPQTSRGCHHLLPTKSPMNGRERPCENSTTNTAILPLGYAFRQEYALAPIPGESFSAGLLLAKTTETCAKGLDPLRRAKTTEVCAKTTELRCFLYRSLASSLLALRPPCIAFKLASKPLCLPSDFPRPVSASVCLSVALAQISQIWQQLAHRFHIVAIGTLGIRKIQAEQFFTPRGDSGAAPIIAIGGEETRPILA